VSVVVTGDGGTQSAGGGAVTHEGSGFHTYAPTQAETNFDHVAFTFTGTGAITTTVQVYTTALLIDDIWDEPKAGHVAAGSFGEEMQAHALSTEVTALNDITGIEAADALLARNVAGGSNGGRTVSDGLRRLRNRVAIAGATMTVYEEDDTTSAWTAAVTTTAGDPVSQVDPA
jgi:hypothetical protein